MFLNRFKFPLFYTVIVSFFLYSCSSAQIKKYTKIKKPEIKYQKYKIISATDKQVKLNVYFNANNPNDIGIDSFFMNYELFVNNKSFVKGLKVKLQLIPKGKTVIILPINIRYKNLKSSIRSVAKLIVKGERSVPIAADIEIFGKFKVMTVIEKDYRFHKNIMMNIPLPRQSMKDVKSFIKGLR